MLSWERKQKLIFLSKVVTFFLLVFSVYGLYAFYKAPNCSNGKKDGDERGADCGGRCLRVCRADTKLPLVQFVRALEVDGATWSVVAYLENQNEGVGARHVPYRLKLYDTDNLLIYERRGEVFIPPRKTFAIYEGKMDVGTRIPTKALFEFLAEPVFEHVSQPALILETKDFIKDEHGVSLQAVLSNPKRVVVEGINLTALLFDEDGNVTGASATFVPTLRAEGSTLLTFTWPRQLERPARTEVLYTVPGKN